MSVLKAVHIHTDPKFLNNTDLFDGPQFSSQTVLVDQEDSFKDFFPRKDLILMSSARMDEIVALCLQADLVVLYELDFIKSRIALALPKEINLIWRFFGYELYSRRKSDYISAASLQHDEWERQMQNESLLKKVAKRAYHIMKYGSPAEKLFTKAIKRINLMLVLSPHEYRELLQFWPYLPPYVKINHKPRDRAGLLKDFQKKEVTRRKIVLGNGRNSYNNHLDILEIVEKSGHQSSYDFELLFNYGTEGEYSSEVRKMVSGKPYYTLIDQFIDPKEFKGYYEDKSALVINSYRQLASGNIFLAFENGVKVYMNIRNAHYHWLKEEGFMVYTMEDFGADLQTGNVYLKSPLALKNQETLISLGKKYTKKKFQGEVIARLDLGI